MLPTHVKTDGYEKHIDNFTLKINVCLDLIGFITNLKFIIFTLNNQKPLPGVWKL